MSRRACVSVPKFDPCLTHRDVFVDMMIEKIELILKKDPDMIIEYNP